jgi:hypothetical protein
LEEEESGREAGSVLNLKAPEQDASAVTGKEQHRTDIKKIGGVTVMLRYS